MHCSQTEKTNNWAFRKFLTPFGSIFVVIFEVSTTITHWVIIAVILIYMITSVWLNLLQTLLCWIRYVESAKIWSYSCLIFNLFKLKLLLFDITKSNLPNCLSVWCLNFVIFVLLVYTQFNDHFASKTDIIYLAFRSPHCCIMAATLLLFCATNFWWFIVVCMSSQLILICFTT